MLPRRVLLIVVPLAQFQRQVREFDPDVVGANCFTECYDSAVSVTKKVQELAPRARIVMGGPHVTFTVEQTFAECAVDYVVLHEGENTLLELLLHLELPDVIPAKRVRGLAWRDTDRIVVNEPRPFMTFLAQKDYETQQARKRQRIDSLGAVSLDHAPGRGGT